MSDKLSRAKHTREAVERELLQLPDTTGSFHRIGELGFEIDEADYDPYAGRHAKRASAGASSPEKVGRHAKQATTGGYTRSSSPNDAFGRHGAALAPEPEIYNAADDMLARTPDGDDVATELASPPNDDDSKTVSSSAALISVCVMISRITGFVRTWAMAFALGSTLLASSYTVANNLPNMLYELVAGGMIVTAFLPVYVSVKKKLGTEEGNRYASNLLTLVVILLGIVSLICMAFPAQAIFTQSFYSDQSEMATSVFFFQFFAIQIVFYGASAVVSGLLNANRDYLWSSIAPVANNVIVIATFFAYALIAPNDPELACSCRWRSRYRHSNATASASARASICTTRPCARRSPSAFPPSSSC